MVPSPTFAASEYKCEVEADRGGCCSACEIEQRRRWLAVMVAPAAAGSRTNEEE